MYEILFAIRTAGAPRVRQPRLYGPRKSDRAARRQHQLVNEDCPPEPTADMVTPKPPRKNENISLRFMETGESAVVDHAQKKCSVTTGIVFLQ